MPLASCEEDLPEDANHEAVDLGLSVKWATCNVGANSPEDYGTYYQWGEIEGVTEYNRPYKYFQPIELEDGFKEYSPECWHNIVSNISGTSYDVAHVKWGKGWRMPTRDEVDELCEMCSWEWTSVNGINGYKVTGPNGNFIFLPAAGHYIPSIDPISKRGEWCCYWASTMHNGKSQRIPNLYFDGGSHDVTTVFFPMSGHPVRPVKD